MTLEELKKQNEQLTKAYSDMVAVNREIVEQNEFLINKVMHMECIFGGSNYATTNPKR